MAKLIERQVIVNWYTPEEKMPPEGMFVPVTVSGTIGCITFDHALAIASWFDDGEGWGFDDSVLAHADKKRLTIHAWCDLEPYGGKV